MKHIEHYLSNAKDIEIQEGMRWYSIAHDIAEKLSEKVQV